MNGTVPFHALFFRPAPNVTPSLMPVDASLPCSGSIGAQFPSSLSSHAPAFSTCGHLPSSTLGALSPFSPSLFSKHRSRCRISGYHKTKSPFLWSGVCLRHRAVVNGAAQANDGRLRPVGLPSLRQAAKSPPTDKATALLVAWVAANGRGFEGAPPLARGRVRGLLARRRPGSPRSSALRLCRPASGGPSGG